MYGSLPASVFEVFATQPVTMNNHQHGISPANFAAAPGLAERFTVLSTNVDRAGLPFVSSMEGKDGLPVGGTQYHPEKVQFECEWQRSSAAFGRCARRRCQVLHSRLARA